MATDARVDWPRHEAAIRGVRERQNAAIAAHDMEGIRAGWAADVAVTTSAGEARMGADSYAEGLGRAFAKHADCVYVRTPRALQPSTVPGLALEQGTWVGTWTAAAPADGGGAGAGAGAGAAGVPAHVRMSGHYMAQWRLEGAAAAGGGGGGAAVDGGEPDWRIRAEVFVAVEDEAGKA